jgi:transposase-like protein
MSLAPDIREDLITAEVVKVLLEYGANPNQKYKGRTCWQNALLWQYEQSVALSGEVVKTPSQGQELAEIRASIFSLLLKKGADTNVFCEVAKGKLSVEQVFNECFKNLAPLDLESLLQLLASQRATSHRFKMPWRLWKQIRTRG